MTYYYFYMREAYLGAANQMVEMVKLTTNEIESNPNDNINNNDYNWNEYIVESKVILKDMLEIDFSKFQELEDDYYCLKITDYETYEQYAKNYNFRKIDKNDFDNIFVEIIIRKNRDNTIKYDDMIKGYEYISAEENYSFPVMTGETLDISGDFKYPCIVGYFHKHYEKFYFKVIVQNESINVSKERALQIAQNYLTNLTYKGYSNFTYMDFVRIDNKYGNNFLDIKDKENPVDDTSKKYMVWSISGYSQNDPCTWANIYVDTVTGKIVGGILNFATD